MFKTDSFLGNKKSSSNQNVWRDHATMHGFLKKFLHYATGCFVAFLGDISILKSDWNMKKLFCCPALELFHFLCLLWKTVLFVSSRAFSMSTPTFSLSTPVDKSEATWKKRYKMQQKHLSSPVTGSQKISGILLSFPIRSISLFGSFFALHYQETRL